MQTAGALQTTPAHRSTHRPVFSSQCCPCAQVTWAQRSGTQNVLTHLYPLGQGNSPPWQTSVQAPSRQANFDGHVALTSALPSQSLSLPSQISAAGPMQPSQTIPPLRHNVFPAVHTPTPTCACVSLGQRQAAPTPGRTPSSMRPLQSSSLPLHVSGLGMLIVLQTSLPFTQTVTPAEQVPMPLPQATPTPGN